MAGTGDSIIAEAERALKSAQAQFEAAGRAQASPGHSERLKDAERARDNAATALSSARQRWGR
jgi:hypothetical protein